MDRGGAVGAAPGGAGLERLARYWPLLIVALVAVLYLPVLGMRPFRFEEGRRFAQALAILHGGSWWRLETFGIPYVNKPPMLPWLIALGARLPGVAEEVAARLPGLLAMMGGALMAGLLAARMAAGRSALAALFAAIFYLATHTVFSRAMLSETDAAASFFAAGAFLVWALARLCGGSIGAAAWLGIAGFIAACLLTKGPVPLLFALLPIAAVPIRERRWGELGAVGLCLLAGLVPLGLWLFLNADAATVARMSGELRLSGSASYAWLDYLAAEPGVLGEAILTSMPVGVTGLIWGWQNRSWRMREAGWLDHALFLYAVPATLLVLFWPHSAGRYIMPAAWPLAVMSGLWCARSWQDRRVRIAFAVILALFVAIQIGFVAREGRTRDQIAQRREALALRQAFAPVPAGRVLLVAKRRGIFNRFVYAGRRIDLIEPDQLACPPEGEFLLVEDPWRGQVDPASWTRQAEIADGALTLYRRTSTAGPACVDRASPAAAPD